jgi:hypothetical protein
MLNRVFVQCEHTSHSASISAVLQASSMQFTPQYNFCRDISSLLLKPIIHQQFIEYFVLDDVLPQFNTRTSAAIIHQETKLALLSHAS